MPELSLGLETGYLAEKKNLEDFIKGIQTFLNNDELRKSSVWKLIF
jgi:hypothetical protein